MTGPLRLNFPAFCAILAALVASGPINFAHAQEAAPAAAPAIPKELQDAVERYWHLGKVANYSLAVLEAQKIAASGAEPKQVLEAFEAVAAERGDNIDEWLLRFQGIEAMKESTTQVIGLVAQGYVARRSDPKFILEQIDRLSINERAYGLAMSRLRESGELAVPFMVNMLRDPAKKQLQPTLRRALRDLGRYALNPLVAATEMEDWDTLVVVIGVLSDLGYDSAAPYISRLLISEKAPPSIKAAATEALVRVGAGRLVSQNASDLYFDLADRIYNERSSLTADTRFPTANIWYWKPEGLVRIQVPQQIFSELMTMRCTEYTLKLGGNRSDDALSLWLAANYRREAELPEGANDATRPEGYPPGHYWGVASGAKYLHAALARALRDHNAAVAFRAIRSLQEIVGQSNLFIDQSSRPLIEAMQYPDRAVRFEAAFALAGALPQTRYEGSQRVVPLLVEALAQTGTSGVLVVMPTADATNKMVDELKAAGGYIVAGASNADGIVNASAALPAIDVIMVSEDIGPGNVDRLFNVASENVRLAGAARLVMVKTGASLYEPRKAYDSLLSTTTSTDVEGLKNAIEEARKKVGTVAMDAENATKYATRAGELLIKVGISRGQVYELAPAKATLLQSLNDTRPEIVKLAGQVLGLVSDKEAQAGLLAAAQEEKNADDVKISLYKSLAINAKFFGNQLDATQIQALAKVVAEATNLELRAAAAEARGALNLPADQAKTLVVGQSKV